MTSQQTNVQLGCTDIGIAHLICTPFHVPSVGKQYGGAEIRENNCTWEEQIFSVWGISASSPSLPYVVTDDKESDKV